jgi:hypothetical protein
MAAPGVIPMKCDDSLRDEGLAADGEQIAVTGGPEPPDPDPLVSNWRPDAICAARRSNRRPPDPENRRGMSAAVVEARRGLASTGPEVKDAGLRRTRATPRDPKGGAR